MKSYSYDYRQDENKVMLYLGKELIGEYSTDTQEIESFDEMTDEDYDYHIIECKKAFGVNYQDRLDYSNDKNGYNGVKNSDFF